MVHAYNSILLSVVKKFLSLANAFNKEKLLTTAACTTEREKPVQMPREAHAESG